ncbi:hypothetical protein L3X38_015587 [Prunus dulcis]|uniref:Uncharacterized protein n=1 Tax=Prunus dulcis TaxID=3755 RepID=A0AAD4W3N9_PRUDU|nr:hypothetical protein L3X38_015587 [Prunus dulcis]
MYSKLELKHCTQSKLPLGCTPVIPSIPLAGLGATQSIRAANPSRIQGTIVSLIRWQVSVTQSQLEPLWQDSGDHSQPGPQSWQVSRTRSQPSRKSWQVSGHQVCRAANPGTHGPSVLETREAMSSALTKLKMDWMPVDIGPTKGNHRKRAHGGLK